MKILIAIFSLLIILPDSNAQIKDGNFEKWDTAFYWILPVNSQYEIVPRIWDSNNQIHPDWHPFLVSTPASRSDQSPIDEFSAKVESKSCGIDACYSGWMFQDIPLKNLDEISFWAKCDSLSGNSGCFIEVFGFNETDNLEVIYLDSIKEENSEFFRYLIKVDDLTSVDYDSIRLQFRAKGVGGFEEPHLLGHTIFLIDGVESSYLSNLNNPDTEMTVFPNPFSKELEIKYSRSKNLNIEIVDMFGILIRKFSCDDGKCKVNLNELRDGVYFIKTSDEYNSTRVQKIIKKSP